MKKILALGALLLFTACTSMDISKPKEIVTDTIRDLLVDDTGESPVAVQEEQTQEPLSLTTENVPMVLGSIREAVKANQKMSFDENIKKLRVYAGQYVEIKDSNGVNSVKMTLSPRRTSPKLTKEGNTILFRSIYQGIYVISWQDLLGASKQVQVENLLKYKFTAEENYAIISRNFQDKNLKGLDEAVSLYQLAFPDGSHLRQSMLFLVKLSTEKADKKIAKEALRYWNQLQGLSKEEQEQVLAAKTLLGEVPSEAKETPEETNAGNVINQESYSMFRSHYQSGNRKATLHLYEGAIQEYLAALAVNQNFRETSQLYQGLGDSYFGLGKYQESVNSFQKSLSAQTAKEKSEKGAELYYKIASAYNKLNNKAEYKKYLSIVKENYPNTLWGRKAYIELMKLN